MSKPIKTVRRTVIVYTKTDIPVANRAMEWELASRNGGRRVHRVEHAYGGAGVNGESYILDLELTCRGANRHDFTKFVQTYLPEVRQHFITD